MGFPFRKGIRFGPVRLNLFRSGLGSSTGGKGPRVSTDPRATDANIGWGGLRYTPKPGGKARRASVPSRPPGLRARLVGLGVWLAVWAALLLAALAAILLLAE